MTTQKDVATLLLRLTLAAGFLSSVASRLSLWGQHSSGWEKFLKYTGEVNSFAPISLIPFLAITATILETGFGGLLLIGLMTRFAAIASSVLTLIFALAMTYSFGIKEPLDYSVFVFSGAAFLLSTATQYRWSIDEKINRS
ncbi:MAG: DoxX family membrane protein [Pyrinomonadaceae bacterium]